MSPQNNKWKDLKLMIDQKKQKESKARLSLSFDSQDQIQHNINTTKHPSHESEEQKHSSKNSKEHTTEERRESSKQSKKGKPANSRFMLVHNKTIISQEQVEKEDQQRQEEEEKMEQIFKHSQNLESDYFDNQMKSSKQNDTEDQFERSTMSAQMIMMSMNTLGDNRDTFG